MKESFILHTDAWPAIQRLTREQQGDLLAAIMRYQVGEELPHMDSVTAMAFEFIRAQMDRDNEKYDKIVEKRREAGRRSAEARSKSQQVLTSVNHTDTDNVNVNDTDTDNERYVSLAALPPLSRKDEESLREAAGDRADGLIEDVKRYYGTHPEKRFPGWPVALAQFDSNQRRWGAAPKSKKMSPEERAIAAFLAEGEDDEARSE